ncbi:hypothetical protein HYFRA_00010381 [Hymenoscyphus fraxineus]|uniref:Uncharacterized protein n=1 Tax=Hymenoscyphus fraxineus TaxID=746836 RepID=A0A9N9PVR4_9HELO|nr:hypothetical protein HYFRA_00010381 [Hymenoscyphus fraxineus]
MELSGVCRILSQEEWDTRHIRLLTPVRDEEPNGLFGVPISAYMGTKTGRRKIAAIVQEKMVQCGRACVPMTKLLDPRALDRGVETRIDVTWELDQTNKRSFIDQSVLLSRDHLPDIRTLGQ